MHIANAGGFRNRLDTATGVGSRIELSPFGILSPV